METFSENSTPEVGGEFNDVMAALDSQEASLHADAVSAGFSEGVGEAALQAVAPILVMYYFLSRKGGITKPIL